MRVESTQRGFAIALLLWMIAGMSLMVAAVIHFAQADVGMAELRLREAKAQALGRGVARLLLRDSAMATYTRRALNGESGAQQEGEESQLVGQQLFSKQYQFGDDWVVSGVLRPSSGFVSLNNADQNELMMLFTGLGKVDERAAAAMVQGVLEYRSNFPGFRYPEELLAVADSSRVIYDKVKAYVHTYRTGSMVVSNASPQLADLARSVEGGGADAASVQGTRAPNVAGDAGRGRIEGRITFESIAEAIRNPNGANDLAIHAAEMEMSFPGDAKLKQTVWVSDAGTQGVLRSGPVTVIKKGQGKQ